MILSIIHNDIITVDVGRFRCYREIRFAEQQYCYFVVTLVFNHDNNNRYNILR